MAENTITQSERVFNVVTAFRRVMDSKPEELNSSERLVACALIRHADSEGESFPSLAALVARTALSRSTVKRALRTLEGKGVIAVSRCWGRVNRYRVLMEPGSTESLGPQKTSIDPKVQRGKTGVNPTRDRGRFTENLGGVPTDPTLGSVGPPEVTQQLTKRSDTKEYCRRGRRALADVPVSYMTWIRRTKAPREAVAAVRYFARKYQETQGRPHPRLPLATWEDVASGILTVTDPGTDGTWDLDPLAFRHLAREYFATDFREAVDYAITHFATAGVKVRLWWTLTRQGEPEPERG